MFLKNQMEVILSIYLLIVVVIIKLSSTSNLTITNSNNFSSNYKS